MRSYHKLTVLIITLLSAESTKSQSISPSTNTTSNTTTPWPKTTPTPKMTTPSGFLGTSDGQAVLAILIIILLLLIAVPVIVYLLVRKACIMKRETSEKQTHIDQNDNDKVTQTDVIGLELQEFYQRRKPTDMSKYFGKSLIDVEQPPRFHQVNPKDWNDPWSQKFNGKEVNYIGKVW